MNIFVLDEDPVLAAKYHCDKHVVKMILESATMLSAAHHLYPMVEYNYNTETQTYDGWTTEKLFKKAWVNHPCTKWARESIYNYQWLSELAIALCDEYTLRYNKQHKTSSLIRTLLYRIPLLPKIDFTPFVQAMPDDVKNQKDAIAAYRNYYIKYKSGFAKWTLRGTPYWYKIMLF
jgi:hypothetical protein